MLLASVTSFDQASNCHLIFPRTPASTDPVWTPTRISKVFTPVCRLTLLWEQKKIHHCYSFKNIYHKHGVRWLLTLCGLSCHVPFQQHIAHALCCHPGLRCNSNNLPEFWFFDSCFSAQKGRQSECRHTRNSDINFRLISLSILISCLLDII